MRMGRRQERGPDLRSGPFREQISPLDAAPQTYASLRTRNPALLHLNRVSTVPPLRFAGSHQNWGQAAQNHPRSTQPPVPGPADLLDLFDALAGGLEPVEDPPRFGAQPGAHVQFLWTSAERGEFVCRAAAEAASWPTL
jgi:hypothetical protein